MVFLLLARVPLPTVRQLSAEAQRRHAAKAHQIAREDGGDSDDDSNLGDDDGLFAFRTSGDAESDDGAQSDAGEPEVSVSELVGHRDRVDAVTSVDIALVHPHRGPWADGDSADVLHLQGRRGTPVTQGKGSARTFVDTSAANAASSKGRRRSKARHERVTRNWLWVGLVCARFAVPAAVLMASSTRSRPLGAVCRDLCMVLCQPLCQAVALKTTGVSHAQSVLTLAAR